MVTTIMWICLLLDAHYSYDMYHTNRSFDLFMPFNSKFEYRWLRQKACNSQVLVRMILHCHCASDLEVLF